MPSQLSKMSGGIVFNLHAPWQIKSCNPLFRNSSRNPQIRASTFYLRVPLFLKVYFFFHLLQQEPSNQSPHILFNIHWHKIIDPLVILCSSILSLVDIETSSSGFRRGWGVQGLRPHWAHRGLVELSRQAHREESGQPGGALSGCGLVRLAGEVSGEPRAGDACG